MRAGLARERVALATRRDSRDLGFVFPVLRIRDPGQRNRHGSYIPPGPYYEARFVGACLQAKGRLCRPAKVAPQDSRDAVNAAVRKLSGILPGAALPFAGWARSHKPAPPGVSIKTAFINSGLSRWGSCVVAVRLSAFDKEWP